MAIVVIDPKNRELSSPWDLTPKSVNNSLAVSEAMHSINNASLFSRSRDVPFSCLADIEDTLTRAVDQRVFALAATGAKEI